MKYEPTTSEPKFVCELDDKQHNKICAVRAKEVCVFWNYVNPIHTKLDSSTLVYGLRLCLESFNSTIQSVMLILRCFLTINYVPCRI